MPHDHNIEASKFGVTRRHFLEMGAGMAGLAATSLPGAEMPADPALARAIARLDYLTPEEKFRTGSRNRPRPDELTPAVRREAGLDRETWKLEIVPDPESDCRVERPMTKAAGTALDWRDLMKLAEKHAVSFLKVMTCLNVPDPFGMGLWEGVPLREVLWLARPKGNIRRIYFYGYHNNNPKQRFQSSLSINRVLEDPPGANPVILCYKMNGDWLSLARGGPVRLISPEDYGFRNIKWVERIVLTNDPTPNDNYARKGLDTDSPMKTFARFVDVPARVKTGQPVPVTGLAQVGVSGLDRVQYCLHPDDAPLQEDDPYFTTAEWVDAEILPPPKKWGGGLPGDKLPSNILQVDPVTGRPDSWPMHYTIAQWAALLPGLKAGRYELRCRSVDARGVAQPMPRPFAKSGKVGIQSKTLVVEG